MAGESWNPPSDAALSIGSVGLSAHILAIRDLTAALAARVDGAPWLNGIGALEVFRVSDTWVVPTGVYRVQVTVIGAGGAGGAGIDNNSSGPSAGAGGGGGAGGYTWKGGLYVVPGEALTITVGTGGSGGAGTGGSGGTSEIHYSGHWFYRAYGGAGGAAGTATGAVGGNGAYSPSPPGIQGARGEDGVVVGPMHGFSGAGAASALGGGAAAVTADSIGFNAVVPGSGGSGGLGINQTGTVTRNGGNGAHGIVLIEY